MAYVGKLATITIQWLKVKIRSVQVIFAIGQEEDGPCI